MKQVRQWLCLTAAGMMLLVGATAAWAEEGGEAHPGTWLNWLYNVKVAGHPLVTDTAELAFAWSLLVILALSIAVIWGARRLSVRPGKFQSLLELGWGALDSVIVGMMGPRGKDFFPFIGSIFIYVFVMNLMGIIPGFYSPTANFSITAAMAVMIFIVVQFYGLKEQGIRYFKHFLAGLPPGLIFYVLLGPLIFVIHIIGEFIRPISLSIRLFGNISGEETVVAALVGLMAGTHYFWWVPVQLPNLALGLLTSFVQALIMTLLAAVYLTGVLHSEEQPMH